MHFISIFSTIVAFAFAVAILRRYAERSGIHLLLWGVGMALYGLGTLTEALMLFTFHPVLLKIWYLAGAMLTAAWLGQGTVHLLIRKRGVAMVLTYILAAVSLVAIVLVLAAPVTATGFNFAQPVSGQYKELMTRSAPVVILTILLNIYGTLGLVGGALYSAFLFWRKKVLINRLTGNILIAAGAMMPAMGGTFIRAGLPDWLYLSELLGAIIMYAGFMLASSKKTLPQPAGVQVPVDAS